MKNILLIQARLNAARAEQERAEFTNALPSTARLECVSVLDQTRLWDQPVRFLEGYDAVLIGGSGDFHLHGGSQPEDGARKNAQRILEKLKPLVMHMLSNDLALFGICFGHQLVAEMTGGGVTHDHVQKKTGTFEVHLTEEGKNDPLFGGLPESFLAQYAHKDSVTSLPRNAVLLATGPVCKFSALRYGSRVYSVQFHPESTRASMIASGRQMPHYMPEGISPEELFKDSSEASSLIGRFIEVIA